jgi:hypothetical protein
MKPAAEAVCATSSRAMGSGAVTGVTALQEERRAAPDRPDASTTVSGDCV